MVPEKRGTGDGRQIAIVSSLRRTRSAGGGAPGFAESATAAGPQRGRAHGWGEEAEAGGDKNETVKGNETGTNGDDGALEEIG